MYYAGRMGEVRVRELNQDTAGVLARVKDGEEIAITARRVVTFHASQKLKGAVARA